MAITPALLMSNFTTTGVVTDSSLTFSVVVLPQLYLGTITLIRGLPGERTSGNVNKGSPRRPALAQGRISAEFWDKIYADSSTLTQTINLRYTMTSPSAGTFNEIAIGLV